MTETTSLVAHDVMSVSGGVERTTVTYAATFDLKGIARFAAPVLAPALKRLVDRGADGLERALQRL